MRTTLSRAMHGGALASSRSIANAARTTLAALLACFVLVAWLVPGCDGDSDEGLRSAANEGRADGAAQAASIGIAVRQREGEGGEMREVALVDGQYRVDAGLSVHFSAELRGIDDEVERITWDFGDRARRQGWNAFRPSTRHSFSGPGLYQVSLAVSTRGGSTLRIGAPVLVESRDEEPPGMPGELVATSVTPSQVNLRWTAPEEELRVARYRVLRDGVAVGTTTHPDFVDARTQPVTPYRYSVTALDESGNESKPSLAAEVLTLEPGHFAPRVETRAVSGTRVDLQWSEVLASGEQGYAIYRDEREIGRAGVGFFSDPSLEPATSYAYSIALLDQNGAISARSPAAAVTTLAGGRFAPFTLAVLPDTQMYSRYFPAIFESQTRWIRRNRVGRNIVFALHEGDITDTNSEEEWAVAIRSIGLLEGYVPYALSIGNHDVSGALGTTRITTRFNESFPVASIANRADFGAVFEAGRLDNAYYRFEAGGLSWLVLSLELGPRNAVLDWANDVAARHPHHNVVVLTHSYLTPDDRRTEKRASGEPNDDYLGRDWNDGEAIWRKLVRRHANMRIVLCGHELGDGIGRLVSEGDHGNTVQQLLANYQMQPLGGAGNLRLLEIDAERDRISVTTYSPYLDHLIENRPDQQNRFVIEGADFVRPAGVR